MRKQPPGANSQTATSSNEPAMQLLLPFRPSSGDRPATGLSERAWSTTTPRSCDSNWARLFVPLASEPYHWFDNGEKLWELRRYGRQYTLDNVCVGRPVELRRGYNTSDSIWGTIADVITAESVDDFFSLVDFGEVIPTARNKGEAITRAKAIIGKDAERVIGFRVSST